MSRIANNEYVAESQPQLTLKDVEDVLADISFFPSSVAEASDTYTFEAKEIATGDETIDGFLIRCGFFRPDTQTGEMGKGYGRWNHVPKFTTVKGVVMTAYVAYKLVVEHEMMESFGYLQTRILDPHKSLIQLAYPNAFPRRFRISSVEWDIDSPALLTKDLPDTKIFSLPKEMDNDPKDEINDYIFDQMTNFTGFCISAANIEEVF